MLFISVLIFFDLFVNVGYFIKIGSYEVTYSEYLLIVVFIYTIYFLLTLKYSKKMFFVGLSFILTVFITEIWLGLNPILNLISRNGELFQPKLSVYSIMISFKIILMSVIAINWKKVININYLMMISSYLKKYAKWVIVLCFIEFLTKNIFHSSMYTDLVSQIFGIGESTVSFIFQRGSLYTLQGLTREPSLLTLGLFNLAIILLFDNQIKRIAFEMIVITFLLFVSGSFASVVYILGIFAIVFFKYKQQKKYFLFIPSGILIITIFMNSNIGRYYLIRFQNIIMFFSNQTVIQNTSEVFRFTTIMDSLYLFLDRPLFGVGLGIPYSYGFISGILASIGLVGFVIWFYFIFLYIGGNSLRTSKYLSVIFIVWFFTGDMSILYGLPTILLACIIGNEQLLQSSPFSNKCDNI